MIDTQFDDDRIQEDILRTLTDLAHAIRNLESIIDTSDYPPTPLLIPTFSQVTRARKTIVSVLTTLTTYAAQLERIVRNPSLPN